MSTIRKAIADLSVLEKLTDESIIDDMNKYFNRIDDHAQVRDSIIVRYGQRIKKVQNPNNPDQEDEVYAAYDQQAFKKKVKAGMVGAISMGFGNKIASGLATMFTEPNQKFTLTHDSVEDLNTAQELLTKKRQRGGFDTAIVKCDKQGCQIGCSVLFMSHLSRRLRYQQISPSSVRGYWAESIIDEDEERAVDTKDIEDASVVIIRLNRVDYVRWNYLAILGRSEIYPNGRWVQYQADEGSTAIPDVDDKGSYDHKIEGKPANPLSYWANKNPDMDLPEYPISVLVGGITESDDPFPITYSLYEDCKEIDISGSHLNSTSQEAARGTRAIERSEIAKNMPLPKTTGGDVALLPGQTMVNVPHDGQNSVHGVTVLKDLMKSVGSGYSLADYMVVSEDHLLDASSGIALAVKTMPLQKFRRLRCDENQPFVYKTFQIEKSYIAMFAESDEKAAANLLMQCEQTWEPGELILPENKMEESSRIISLKKEGVLDEIGAIQEYYKYPSEDEAIEHYEKMKQRRKDYPPLAQEDAFQQRPSFGLRNRARQQQTPNNDQGQQ